MSVDNTILIPIFERETIRGPVTTVTRFYSAEGTWQLGASLAGARIALQCSHIEEGTQIVAGMDWSVDGRNWEVNTDATTATFFPEKTAIDAPDALSSPGNYMSVEYRPATGDTSKFGPYTRFWIGVADYNSSTAAPRELSAMITAVVIGRTV